MLNLIIGLVIGLVVVIVIYYILNLKLQYQQDQTKELKKLFDSQGEMIKEKYEKIWAERKQKLRREIADQQRSTVKGKVTEQIISLLRGEVFPYNPADARFLGAPIDYIIFDGYTKVKDEKSSDAITIILADVKTGGGKLSPEQRKIKEAVEEKRVVWRTIELPDI